jgi:heptosyltransferase-2
MSYENILVRATNWIGDAVMSLPALRALRQRFPRARITILAMPWVADLYGREPFCDELIPWTARRGWRDIGAKWAAGHALRGRFDCAVILPNSFDSALPAFLAGVPRRIGFARDGRSFLLTDRVAPIRAGDTPPHQSFHYLELLRRAGLIEALPSSLLIRLDGAAAARTAGAARLAAMGFPAAPIGVSPGAAFGGAKRWLPERFAESAMRLARELGTGVALFGSKDERPLCEEIASQVAGVAVHNFAGETSLREFIDLAAACRLFLTNDSGSMHVASALGLPTVAVFGSTDHVATGPTGPLARVVREPIECTPCLQRECPLGHLNCMKLVTVERVAREAGELLGVREG